MRVARRARTLVLLAALVLTGCVGAARRAGTIETAPPDPAAVAERWGVEIVSLRESAAGSMIDFRFRIVDPDKAVFLTDRTIDAYLTDERSGRTVTVPNTAKLGPLRQTQKYGSPPAGRIFFILFGNPGRMIEAGSTVTISIGDFEARHLVVE